MRQKEFLKQLNQALHGLDPLERARMVQYYREILEDRMEEGCSEEDAVAEMEPVEKIAARLLSDSTVRQAARPRRAGWGAVLIVLGSPLWLAFVLAAAAVVLAMYVVVWSFIAALFAVIVALGCGLIAGVAAMILYWAQFPMTGLFLLGAGLVCAGVGTALFFPVVALAKCLVRGTARGAKAVWRGLFRRRGEAA